MQVADRFICAKDVDSSLLRQGFTLPVGMLFGFKSWFGEFMPGASRDVTVRLNGASFSVRLGNRDFDREKWPEHPEMYQLRYTETSAFAKALREQFKTSLDFIDAELVKLGKSSKRHIRSQICGRQVAEEYSVSVDEVHHIDPFVTSLNNDVSNLLVLCPNHHCVIHAAHPDFRRQTLSFLYPNGLNEKLKINLHLAGV